MNRNNSSVSSMTAIRIVVIYSIVGCLWILFSDRLLAMLEVDSLQMARIALFKGWIYVGFTALLLYLMIRRYVSRQLELDQELRLNRLTIEHSADEVFWTDERGRIVYANPTATRVTGFTSDELRGMTVHDLSPSFPASLWPEHWRELKQKGSLTLETLQHNKDGSLIDIEVSTNYIRHGDREYTAAFVRDISERKRSQAALLAAESRFRDLLETVHLVAVMLDRECRITFCNDFLLNLSGWTREEILGKGWFDVFIPEEERTRVLSVNKSILSDKIVPHFENHILTKNGERRLIVWNNTILRDPDGASAGTASIGVDVTEHRLLEQERRRLEQQMLHAQKLESLGTMASGIAHDFNNILSAMMGNAELALNRLKMGERIDGYLEKILKSAGQAADLARQMLAYSGKGVFSVMRLDVGSLLEEMRHLLEVVISRQVQLQLDISQPIPAIKADVPQLRQVITNLIINASEAIGDENGTISVTTGSLECDPAYLKGSWPPDGNLPAGRYVYLDVIDNGCGMDGETIARIFDPFFTTKFTGRGLGLAAAMGIVRGHSGCIKVSSIPGEGTAFRVLFPAAAQLDGNA